MNLENAGKSIRMAFDKNFQTIVDWAIRIILPLLLGAIGWVTAEISDVRDVATDNNKRLSVIESNRYTTADAMREQSQLWDRLDGIKTSISELERRMPTRSEFDAMQSLIKSLREDLRAVKQ